MSDLNEKEDRHLFEHIFETILWSGRWSVLLAVIGGILTSFVMFFIASFDVYHLANLILQHMAATDAITRAGLRSDIIGHAVEVIDGFLLAIVLLIFSYGIFELYVSKIVQAYGTSTAQHLLKINSLDDLKARLGKVILMILVVKFFEVAISMDFETMKDLMLFSVAIILIGTTLFMNQAVEYVVHNKREKHQQRRRDEADSQYERRGEGNARASERRNQTEPNRDTADA